ncbi:disks large-associated protein 5-like [Polyergus mexicanus]|uniref:disks large-associated protein 5-like n=1 Tax=Polyergus mexicanus TaxID=615972 RepID=UPI0038B5CA7B
MSDLNKKQYKKPPFVFGNAKKIKSDLAREQREKRKKRRTKDFEENREKNVHINITDEKKKKLLEWKVEREKKKKEQESQKKPPFIVGIVRHNFYSPVTTTNNSVMITKKKTIVQAQKKSSNQKVITKATEKRRANIEKQKAAKVLNAEKAPANDCIDINKRKSFAPLNHKFNPPAELPILHVSIFGEVCVEDNLTNKNNTSARDNSTKNAISVSSSNEFPTKDAIMQNSDMPIEGKEHTVEYFKHLLYKEKDKLQKCCEYWMEIQSRNDITEDIRCHINQAIGQTTLLINKKFKRFDNLILLCEKGNAVMPITCTDLHGFWDLIYIEVKDCNLRFEKLKNVQARHWQGEQSSYTNSAKKEMNAKKRAVSRSSLQASISSDKKRKMVKTRDNEKDPHQILFQPVSTEINTNNEFITPLNDKGTAEIIDKSCNVTRRKCCKDLLKVYAHPMYTSTPLLNNADKSNNMNASLVTMKISQLYNKCTMQTDDHTCISPEQTSRKGIMEKSEESRQSLIRSLARDNTIDSSVASSFSTLIAKTMEDQNETLKLVPYNTDLIETPVSNSGIKDKRSLTERS